MEHLQQLIGDNGINYYVSLITEFTGKNDCICRLIILARSIMLMLTSDMLLCLKFCKP